MKLAGLDKLQLILWAVRALWFTPLPVRTKITRLFHVALGIKLNTIVKVYEM